MKRREFLRSTAALAATPAFPIKGLAAGAPVAAADYERAVKWVHKWTMANAGALKSAFGLDQTTANSLFEQLQSDGILAQANSHGLARAAKPWFKDPLAITRTAAPLRPSSPRGERLRDRVMRLLEDPDAPNTVDAEADTPLPQDDPPDTQQSSQPSPPNATASEKYRN